MTTSCETLISKYIAYSKNNFQVYVVPGNWYQRRERIGQRDIDAFLELYQGAQAIFRRAGAIFRVLRFFFRKTERFLHTFDTQIAISHSSVTMPS